MPENLLPMSAEEKATKRKLVTVFPSLPFLNILVLKNCGFGDAGVETLANSLESDDTLPHLTQLDIEN